MKKAVKLGESSLTSTRQFKKVVDIIKADKSRRYVVPSASGKHSDKDEKVTDMLYACYDAVAKGRSYKKILEEIKNRYLDIIDSLNSNLDLDHEFERIEKNFLAKAGRDYAAFRGEYLNSAVTANCLGYEFIDTAEVTFFDDNGNFEADLTNRELSERLEHMERAVIPEFYGSKHDGTVKTLPGGGSGTTGSIVTKAIHADIHEDRTDASGILVTDPRIVDDPEVIKIITYKKFRELSYIGTSALHEDVIFPARKEGIPANIRNTNRPENKGTLIVENTCRKPRHTIAGIVGEKGFCSINIEKAVISAEVGFGHKALSISEWYGISFEHMPSGIDTVTIYIHQSELEEYEQSVTAGVHGAMGPDTVELESDPALTAVVGRGMRSNRGTAGRVFSVLAHARVNIKMADQGSSEWNTIIEVENGDFETVIRAICDIFVITELWERTKNSRSGQ